MEDHPEMDEQSEERDDAVVGTALKWSGVVIFVLVLGVILFVFSRKHEKQEKDRFQGIYLQDYSFARRKWTDQRGLFRGWPPPL